MTEDKNTAQPSEEFQRFDEAVDKLFGGTDEEVREAEVKGRGRKSNDIRENI